MPRAEELHQLFRGSAEAAKAVGWTVLGLEVVAGLIAAWRAWSIELPARGWTPLTLLLLLLVTTGLRVVGRRWRLYSEKCRRVSATAYAANEEPAAATHSDLVADAPPYAEWFAIGLPASDLESYYEPTKPPGVQRLREIYAENSFYTWRLLRAQCYVLALLAGVLLVVGVMVFYRLVQSPVDDASKLADLVCGLVFGVFLLKAGEAAVAASAGSGAARQVADALVRPDAAQAHRIAELVNRYNIDRAAGPAVATVTYKLANQRLQREWRRRREALDAP